MVFFVWSISRDYKITIIATATAGMINFKIGNNRSNSGNNNSNSNNTSNIENNNSCDGKYNSNNNDEPTVSNVHSIPAMRSCPVILITWIWTIIVMRLCLEKNPFRQFNRITNKTDLKQKNILNYQGSLYLDAREWCFGGTSESI